MQTAIKLRTRTAEDQGTAISGREKPLLVEPYVFAEWRVRRVGIDYHVDVEGHFYSVLYRFARAEVEVRLTGRTVEIFATGERIAVHLRSSGNGTESLNPLKLLEAGDQLAFV
jgi:transposase